LNFRARRNRVAASEAIGAMLAIAMTLVAGAAAWGYVRSQAASSESALNSNALNTNNLLNEHFSIVDLYFPTTTSATFILYNTGSLTDQVQSVRLYDSAGLINVYYNSTKHSPCNGDCVMDLKSSLSGECKTAAGSYETPSVTGTTYKTTNEAFFTVTIPPTTSNCPSYGQTISSSNTYTVVVTGIYGNVQTFSQQG